METANRLLLEGLSDFFMPILKILAVIIALYCFFVFVVPLLKKCYRISNYKDDLYSKYAKMSKKDLTNARKTLKWIEELEINKKMTKHLSGTARTKLLNKIMFDEIKLGCIEDKFNFAKQVDSEFVKYDIEYVDSLLSKK